MPEHRYKGVRIYYETLGKGPAVVLLHGFLESTRIWRDIAPELAKNHRVICIDLPGHGRSECIGYVHTMDEMAEAVYAVVRHEKLRKVAMVGHSMGGYVALAFAEHYPDNVRTLVLYQSTARDDSPWKKQDRLRAIDLVKHNHRTFIRQSIPLLFRPVNRKRFHAEINTLREEALKTPLQGVIAALDGMRQRPNREILLKFPPYPVHIIASDKDPRIPVEESRELAAISEHVHLHLIKGCGHMSYIEAPQKALEFLKASV